MKISKLARWVAAPAAVAALTLSGCTNLGSTAGEVDGTVISDTELTRDAEALASVEPGADAQDARAAVLGIAMRGEAARQIEQRRGITVTDAERAAALGQDYNPAILTNPRAKALYDGYADFAVVASKLGTAEMRKAVAELSPKANPRYGVWDGDRCLVQPSSGSLSTKYLPGQ